MKVADLLDFLSDRDRLATPPTVFQKTAILRVFAGECVFYGGGFFADRGRETFLRRNKINFVWGELFEVLREFVKVGLEVTCEQGQQLGGDFRSLEVVAENPEKQNQVVDEQIVVCQFSENVEEGLEEGIVVELFFQHYTQN